MPEDRQFIFNSKSTPLNETFNYFNIIFSRPTLGCNAATELAMHTHMSSLDSSPTHPLMIPSMDRPAGGALALHYAAARGCLDCVRLLVEASPDIR